MRETDEVSILPENGTGPSRFGEIVLDSGAYKVRWLCGQHHTRLHKGGEDLFLGE